MAKSKFVQIESKNALLELLNEGKKFDRIFFATNAYKDEKTAEILKVAAEQKVPIFKITKRALSKKVRNSASENIIGYMYSENDWKLDELLDSIYSNGKIPFFLVLDDIKYIQNIAAIMRTAFAVGVNGLIVNNQKKSLVCSETIRISMGAAERIPIVESSLFAALKTLKDNDIKTFAVHMEGQPYFERDLRGPVAFVLGAEDVGISGGILERTDENISIPMREGIGSLNVSASAAIIVYEKLRQEVRGF